VDGRGCTCPRLSGYSHVRIVAARPGGDYAHAVVALRYIRSGVPSSPRRRTFRPVGVRLDVLVEEG